MKRNEKKIVMIGYRPTKLESMKISHIGKIFNLKSCGVIRELLTGHWTLDELNSLAHKTSPNDYGATLSYLKKVYAPNKSIDDIVRDGDRLYAKEMLGIDESEE
jgi:hypothetical protein